MELLEPLRPGCIMRLLLLRHGALEDRARGRCYGHTDYCLSEMGRRQILQSIKRLKNVPVDMIYTSSLTRARESAQLVAQQFVLEPMPVAELRELHFGTFEALTYEEIERAFPREYQAWMDSPATMEFPGGESFPRVKQRVLNFIREIEKFHKSQTVLLVAHAGVNRIVLADALGFKDESLFDIPQDYAALNVIDYFPEALSVRMLGPNT